MIGLFPNDAGGVDFIADGSLLWLPQGSSAINAGYSTYSTSYSVDTLEGTSNQRYIELSMNLFKFIFPFNTEETFAYSLEPGINVEYLNYDLETYGYRTNTEISTDMRGSALLDLKGAFFPLIYIHEEGEKFYSSLETPISLTTDNAAQGFELSGQLKLVLDNIFEAPMGILNVGVGYFQQFGNHTSDNSIALYNWQTTIINTELLIRRVTTLEISYDITALASKMKVTPSLGFKYVFEEEDYGGTVTSDGIIKIGLSTKL
jgi:hypothetical protein